MFYKFPGFVYRWKIVGEDCELYNRAGYLNIYRGAAGWLHGEIAAGRCHAV
jgi:hypothetical protein